MEWGSSRGHPMHSKSSDSVAKQVQVEVPCAAVGAAADDDGDDDDVAAVAADVPAREDASLPGVRPPMVAAGSCVQSEGVLVLYSERETELAAGGQLGTHDHSKNTCYSEVGFVDAGCMHIVEENNSFGGAIRCVRGPQ